MPTKPHQTRPCHLLSRDGQALAEMTVGLIVMAVVLLSVFLMGDLTRARMKAILDARKGAGTMALSGMTVGAPSFYGSVGAVDGLKTEVLDTTEHSISYSQYGSAGYPYIKNNVVYPFYTSPGTTISIFSLSTSEQSIYVTNNNFLMRMGVGSSSIIITEKACLPIMNTFP